LCGVCAPISPAQLAANQAQAKVGAAREQLEQKARTVDYVSGVDMHRTPMFEAPTPQPTPRHPRRCVDNAVLK